MRGGFRSSSRSAYCGLTEKFVVWISWGSMPSLLSASTTRVIAAVFLASASLAVGLCVSTPALTVTLSGADLTTPLPDMVMVRFGGSLSSATATWLTAGAAAARKASVATRYFRAIDVMDVIGDPSRVWALSFDEPARSIAQRATPRFDLFAEHEKSC